MMDTKTSQEEPPSPHDLIVDFPSKPRIVSQSQDIKSITPLSARPRVQFSKFSQLSMIPYDDAQSKWYTRGEQGLFRNAVAVDARRVINVLQDATPALSSEELLYGCVGIEKFLFESSHAVQMMRAHSDVVLAAQRIHQGNDKIEKISKTSMMSSRCARERAAEVAAHYARSL
jgi:hypothetical protein